MKAAKTLRARLAMWYVLALTVTLSAFAVLLYLWLAQTLYSHHDSELRAHAVRLSRALSNVPIAQEPIADVLRAIDAMPRMIMVRGSQGELIYRSPLLQVAEPAIGRHEALVHAAANAPSDAEFFDATLERLGLVRFICTPIDGVSGAYLQIGNPQGDVPATLHAVGDSSLILVPIIVILTSAGAWLIAGRALAPLSTINVALRDIQATDLSKRVAVNPADRDLHALVVTINGLLGRLDRAFDDLRKFAADASHQLQTPLAVMKGSIEIARRKPDHDQRAVFLDDLEKEVTEMSTVVSDLQSFSLADADLQRAKKVELDVPRLCRDVLEVVTALAEARGVSVHADLEPDVRLSGDAVKLKQILLNLGDNAVKYTPAGGVVRFRLYRDGSSAVFDVIDTGRGIDKLDLPHIFDRFYRSSTDREGVTGSGLGLAIVKRFVEVHDGTIAVDSERGDGTRFSVRLPLDREPPSARSWRPSLVHRWVRDLHLYFGLFISPFVLLFAASVLFLNHAKVPTDRFSSIETVRPVAIPQGIESARGPDAVVRARTIMQQLKLDGEIGSARYVKQTGLFTFPVSRPGLETTVDVNLTAQSATVSRRLTSFWEALAYLHKMPGPHNVNIRGNWSWTRAWHLFADATVYLVLFISVSGVYLWYAIKAERRVGVALLTAGAASLFGLIYAVIR